MCIFYFVSTNESPKCVMAFFNLVSFVLSDSTCTYIQNPTRQIKLKVFVTCLNASTHQSLGKKLKKI